MHSPLPQFLTAEGRDHAGRTFEDVMAFDDDAIERHHDFIQWIFPLTEPSGAVPGAPVLTDADVETLKGSEPAQARLARATARMLAFYQATSAWKARYDHNHLRITRIIKSLRLLADDNAANAFRRAVEALAEAEPIDPKAREFWSKA